MGFCGRPYQDRKGSMSSRKERIQRRKDLATEDVLKYGRDVVRTDIFREAMTQTHHRKTTVADHSASVANMALRMCRRMETYDIHADEKMVVLASLTHDLGIVGRYEKYSNDLVTYFRHPSDSAKIATELLPGMNKKFYKTISRHMFPLTILPPTSLEGLIVSAADKCVSFKELFRRMDRFSFDSVL